MNDDSPETDGDRRRARILESATKTFLAYGYQRTTMADLASAAEMSRPALYLLFRNKAELYRAITNHLMEQAAETACMRLGRDGGIGERLYVGICETIIEALRVFEASPHGADILDMKNSLAGDIIASWHDRMARMVERVIAEDVARTGVDLASRGLSPVTLADIFLDGIEGVKMRVPGEEDRRENMRQLAGVIELALRP